MTAARIWVRRDIAGWCSLCRGSAPVTVCVEAAADARFGFCVRCVDRMATAARVARHEPTAGDQPSAETA